MQVENRTTLRVHFEGFHHGSSRPRRFDACARAKATAALCVPKLPPRRYCFANVLLSWGAIKAFAKTWPTPGGALQPATAHATRAASLYSATTPRRTLDEASLLPRWMAAGQSLREARPATRDATRVPRRGADTACAMSAVHGRGSTMRCGPALPFSQRAQHDGVQTRRNPRACSPQPRVAPRGQHWRSCPARSPKIPAGMTTMTTKAGRTKENGVTAAAHSPARPQARPQANRCNIYGPDTLTAAGWAEGAEQSGDGGDAARVQPGALRTT